MQSIIINNKTRRSTIYNRIKRVQHKAFRNGLKLKVLRQYQFICFDEDTYRSRRLYLQLTIIIGTSLISLVFISFGIQYLLGARCLLPINYLIWEVARPLADCSYCANLTQPVILKNVTQHHFQVHAYSSKPIIVKNAVSNWKAIKHFSYHMFKNLYEITSDSYESLEEGCQFLNFKTDLFSLKEVFNIPEARVKNEPGQKSWYVGWGNCHPDILAKVRKYYDIPNFFPKDAEFPKTENIFFGYEIGAVMHLDYIPRLMWQGQVKGSKNWSIAPVPECEGHCNKMQFYVETGDVVLLDTRQWYHSTTIPKGEFSITVQSEYG